MKKLIFLLLVMSLQCQAYTHFTNLAGDPITWNNKLLEKGYIPWNIKGNPPEIVRQSVLFSIGTWQEASLNAINFKESEEAGGISIVWDENFPVNTFLAFTQLAASGTDLKLSTISINAKDFTFNRNPNFDGSTRYFANLDSVMLHEFGHALGLNHPDDDTIVGGFDPNNLPTMYYIIYKGASTLHPDDIAGIQFLYPSPLSHVEIVHEILVEPYGKKLTFLAAGHKLVFQTVPKDPMLWEFGDGKSAYGEVVRHAFKRAKTYTVKAYSNDKMTEKKIEILRHKPKDN